MAGVKQLRKVQLGLESTAGTAVAATTIWRGAGAAKNVRDVVLPSENVGYLVQVDRAYSPSVGVEIAFDENEATFEQLPYLLSAGVKDVVSGAANGGTSNGYIYDYPLATTAQPTTKAYTIEGGDNQQAEEYEYCFVKSLSLKGSPREAVKMSASWVGRQRTKTSFTGSLSLPAVEEILFQRGKLYLDAASGTIGSTQKTNTWLGFDLTIDTGLREVYTGDGNLYYSFTKCVGPRLTGSLTVEHDANAVALHDDFEAMTTRLMRMIFTGSALTGTGGTYTTKVLQIDAAVKITGVDPLGEVNGNDILKVNFEAVYNSTAALFADIKICNILSTLP